MASVDRLQGLSGDLAIKAPVRVATTAAITLSGLQTIDGVTLVADDRVLVKDQADTTANGIYAASTSSWTRTLDCNGDNDLVNGTFVIANSGTTNAGVMFKCGGTDPITVGTDAITFTAQFTIDTLSAVSALLATLLADGAQPIDASLTAYAALVTAANKGLYFTDADTPALFDLTAFARTLLDDSTAAAARATLGVVDYKEIQPVVASVATNTLTLTLNPTVLDFRDATLTTGTTNTRTVANAISVVVPDTATLGTVNATAARLAMLAIDNAGTVELAVVNLAGGNNLDETTLISTTAITTGADSASVIYSTTARTNVPFRVVGFIDITEATAGTWATAPTTVHGMGGVATVSGQIAKARVAFTGATGAVVGSSFGVSSVTHNAAGNWTVNTTKPISNKTYAIDYVGTAVTGQTCGVVSETATSVVIFGATNGVGAADLTTVFVTIFGD